MSQAGENNIRQESVKEKKQSKAMEILSHHTPFDIANSYSINIKTLKCHTENK